MKNCRILMLVVVLTIFITIITANAEIYKGTGYYPPSKNGYQSRAEAAMEGGAYDCQKNKLRTLQEYKEGSFVSVAVDPRHIKIGSELAIEEFPNIKFIACDKGRKIKSRKIDICTANKEESYKIPRKLTVNIVRRGSGHFQASGGTVGNNGQSDEGRVLKDGANYICALYELARKNIMEAYQAIPNDICEDRMASRGAVYSGGLRCGQGRVAIFCSM